MVDKDNINIFLAKEDKANFKINAIKVNSNISQVLRLFIKAFNNDPQKTLEVLK